MGVDGSGPLGRATLLHRSGGRDPHRVGVLRLQRSDGGHEHGVVADGARQAGDPLLTCGQAVMPEIPECLSGFPAEAEGRARAGGVALRRQRQGGPETEDRDQASAARQDSSQ